MWDTIRRLAETMGRHDLEGVTARLTTDCRSEQPVHLDRGFGGSAQAC